MNKKSIPYKVLWIDVDNTILDFDLCAKQCMKQTFEEAGLTYHEEYFANFQKINTKLWHLVEHQELTMDAFKRIRWNLILSSLGIKDVDGIWFEYIFHKHLHHSHALVQGCKEALERLAQEYTLIVVSNGQQNQQENRLTLAGVRPLFDSVFTSQRLGTKKPDPAFFEKVYQYSQSLFPNLKKKEILVIGDSYPADIVGAVQFGVPALWFKQDQNMDSKEGQDSFVCHTWNEVVQKLQKE